VPTAVDVRAYRKMGHSRPGLTVEPVTHRARMPFTVYPLLPFPLILSLAPDS
jgi:hypothetical protein